MPNFVKPIGKELLFILAVIISAALANLVGIPVLSLGFLSLLIFIGVYSAKKYERAKSTTISHSS
ncbi:hypothetical protein [Kangiella spongicola]|uniref:Uncharacterized protein n=1 Tax=Kangiella spongicola TaxID=796379 RepID=A0A318DA90_9GAMM|nr:hypothetical protein [Kangiella spongicola]PXF64164.1 hypothetical protein DL796_03220 [Kangiella spongicola]